MADKYLKCYDEEFYGDHLDWQGDYLAVSEWINANLKGEVFGDIGCGNGYVIRNLYKNNKKKVWGVDGSKNFVDFVDKDILSFVERVDLTEKQKLSDADVSICLEVAEHIENKFSDTLVENIVSTKPKTIMFTAAVPGQEGTNHINLQPHEFWLKKFENKGYYLNRALSNKFRYDLNDELKATRWYLDNMMILEKKDKKEALTLDEIKKISEKGVNPKVSIVIPCYNMGEFIDDAINSVLTQTFKNYEIIIVDDGSDNKATTNKLDEIRREKPEIKIISQKNSGLSAARNTGIKDAKGEYIVCLDSDDILDTHYLEQLVPILEEDKAGALGFVTPWLKEFGLSNNLWETKDYNPAELLFNNVVVVASLFRKKAWKEVGGYKDIMAGGYEDWEFWISIAEKGYKWSVVPEPLFFYRIREDSMLVNAKGEKHMELYKRLINLHSDFYKKYSLEIAEHHEALIWDLKNKIKYDKEKATNELKTMENKAFAAEEELRYLHISRLIGRVIKFRDFLRSNQRRLKNLIPKLKTVVGSHLSPRTRKKLKYLLSGNWLTRKVVIKNSKHPSDKPLVSVITPYFNHGCTIAETIESVLTQTFQDFEHIIVDDGSNEENKNILDGLSRPDLKIIRHSKNLGKGSPAVARNVGIKHSKGKYIVCLDADDLLNPTFLEKCLSVLETNPNVSMITTHMDMFGMKNCTYYESEFNPKQLYGQNNMMINATMFRKEAWEKSGGYKPKIGYEDWEFWINLVDHGFWGKLIPEALLRYRVLAESRYTGDIANHKENIDAIKKYHPAYRRNIRRASWKKKFKKYVVTKESLFVNMSDTKQYLSQKKTKKNVLIAIPWMTFGGAETLIYNYCHEIKDDFNISFVTGLESENEWEYKFKEISQNIYHLSNLFEDRELYIEFISNYIKTKNIDVLHIIHNNFVYGMLEELKVRHPKLKVIVTLFNDRVDHFSKVFQYEDYIDAFSADNQKVINSLKEGLKGKDNKLVKIPNGIDCNNTFNQQKFDRSAQRSELGLKDDELAVFFVGRLSSEKMPDAFLEAAGKVVKNPKNQKVRFFVIGDGLMRAEIEDKIGKINSENIKYLGYQSDVAKYLSAGDIFVLPSMIEGFPLSILEAMAMKMNVIASDVGAISDIIKDGKDGFIVKPASVEEIAANIEKLNQDRDLLHKVAENARKVVESNYSTEVLGEKYSSLYMEK